ncbi:MAG: DUF3275 family protein [Rhodocyclaceae bacterium]|nr:DUF3275 family protein [Rhodocyclaceae bacterium]MBX3671314.1 DUF3275 family protein [Rhodocyclaceae bacterium]
MFVSNGTISIKAIHGRRGRFCVGDLELPEGSFKVKDEVLDQFDEGRYTGRFQVASVTCESFMWHGRVITEMRVRLGDMHIDSGSESRPESAEALQPEPDPADQDTGGVDKAVAASVAANSEPAGAAPVAEAQGESPGKAAVAAATEVQVEASAPPQAAVPPADASAPAEIETEFMSDQERAQLALLGPEIYKSVAARVTSVQLDPTVGRVKLREQAACLKGLGYRFDGPSQTWNLPA